VEKDVLLVEKTKDMGNSVAEKDLLIVEKDRRLLDGEKLRIEKERLIGDLSADVRKLQDELVRS
jgi:hypothetical protein